MATEAKIYAIGTCAIGIYAIVAINNAGRPGLKWRTTSHKPRATNSNLLCKTNPIYQMLKMNVNKVLTKGYENKWLCRRRENKPNSKPIKPNFYTNMRKTKPIYPYRRGIEPNFYTNMHKTNPIYPYQRGNKPNLVRHSLGDGGFKRGTYTALRR